MTTSAQRPSGPLAGLWWALGAALAMGSAAAALKAMGSTGLPAVNVAQARMLVAAVALMAVAVVVRRGPHVHPVPHAGRPQIEPRTIASAVNTTPISADDAAARSHRVFPVLR